jgi:hypothetical protein
LQPNVPIIRPIFDQQYSTEMKKITTSLLFVALAFHLHSQVQNELNVLFLGNSYTAANDLPSLVAQCAASTGRTVNYQSNTPGGHTFLGHTNNATSQNLIAQGNWDFVVLQEQSQFPSFPISQVEEDCFPYAAILNDSILAHNECAETVFYMTWGRQNGDSQNCANWPPVCTYEGMDDLLNERYRTMAEDNDAILSPVGALWRSIRANYPDIQLYVSDGSHPSVAGSYAAAVSFFTVLYRVDPTEITFNAGLDETSANSIKNEAKTIVYNQLLEEWHVGEYDNPLEPCFLVTNTNDHSVETEQTFAFVSNDQIIISPEVKFDSLELFDISGKKVVSSNNTIGYSLNVNQLDNGTYLLKALDQQGNSKVCKLYISR